MRSWGISHRCSPHGQPLLRSPPQDRPRPTITTSWPHVAGRAGLPVTACHGSASPAFLPWRTLADHHDFQQCHPTPLIEILPVPVTGVGRHLCLPPFVLPPTFSDRASHKHNAVTSDHCPCDCPLVLRFCVPVMITRHFSFAKATWSSTAPRFRAPTTQAVTE